MLIKVVFYKLCCNGNIHLIKKHSTSMRSEYFCVKFLRYWNLVENSLKYKAEDAF